MFHDKMYPAFLKKINNNAHITFADQDINQPIIHGGYNNEKFEFHGLHFHWGSKNFRGSEHLINFQHPPGEAHFVHFNKKYKTIAEAITKADGLLVLAFFLKIKYNIEYEDSGLIQRIANAVKLLVQEDKDEPIFLGDMSLDDIIGNKPGLDRYAFYKGSLTTPPCTENVFWYIFPHPIHVTNADLDAFRQLKDNNGKSMSDNFRPLQAINGRTIRVNGFKIQI